MRVKPFEIMPSILKNFNPPAIDRNIKLVKDGVCEECGGNFADGFMPLVCHNKGWYCITCWEIEAKEKMSANTVEKLSEYVDGIRMTKIIHDNWKYNIDVYNSSQYQPHIGLINMNSV